MCQCQINAFIRLSFKVKLLLFINVNKSNLLPHVCGAHKLNKNALISSMTTHARAFRQSVAPTSPDNANHILSDEISSNPYRSLSAFLPMLNWTHSATVFICTYCAFVIIAAHQRSVPEINNSSGLATTDSKIVVCSKLATSMLNALKQLPP